MATLSTLHSSSRSCILTVTFRSLIVTHVPSHSTFRVHSPLTVTFHSLVTQRLRRDAATTRSATSRRDATTTASLPPPSGPPLQAPSLRMDRTKELRSIAPYLPVTMGSSSSSPFWFWSTKATKAFAEITRGRVHSGPDMFRTISELRSAIYPSSKSLTGSAAQGYAQFFDQVMSKEQSRKWFKEVIPVLGNLLLKLPSLLKSHYENADMDIHGDGAIVTTALRILESQQPGIVFLSQELIAALLACSLFCLYPDKGRHAKHLPLINFDRLFGGVSNDKSGKQKQKIWCIVHYFQRISSDMPKGNVSFERKVLPFENDSIHISYPGASFWSTSAVPLCSFKVHSSGSIEDQSDEAVEVDFADPFLGGLALGTGCVQEEIRFMISPELIAGMLFVPAMADNEAIEIVGVERFSRYTGYSSSFRFAGDYVDQRGVDALGRRKTRIVAIDALNRPRMSQYMENLLLREINKAFCGYLYQCKYEPYQKILQEKGSLSALSDASTSTSAKTSSNNTIRNSQNDYHRMDQDIGVATGNWGCGVFGGDPEIKTIMQWLAASQARRPFIAYYTFGLEALKNLDGVARRISSRGWTAGDLWNMLVVYSANKSKGQSNVSFFQWLLQR